MIMEGTDQLPKLSSLPDFSDPEVGVASQQYEVDYDDDDISDGPFDIANTKNAPVEALRRWRISKLILTA